MVRLTPQTVETIQFAHASEKAFATLLAARVSIIAFYQPRLFRAMCTIEDKDGRRVDKNVGFLPDFLIFPLGKALSEKRYTELTSSEYLEIKDIGVILDPKKIEREVLEKNGYKKKSVFLYRKHIRNMKRAHPELDWGIDDSVPVKIGDQIIHQSVPV